MTGRYSIVSAGKGEGTQVVVEVFWESWESWVSLSLTPLGCYVKAKDVSTVLSLQSVILGLLGVLQACHVT